MCGDRIIILERFSQIVQHLRNVLIGGLSYNSKAFVGPKEEKFFNTEIDYML